MPSFGRRIRLCIYSDDNNAFILWQTLFRPIMGANDRGKTYITVSAVLVALSTIVVGFRIVARWMRTTLGMDDYVICVSIILAYSMLGEAVVCMFPILRRDCTWLIVYRGPRWRARKTHGRTEYPGEDHLPKGEYLRAFNCDPSLTTIAVFLRQRNLIYPPHPLDQNLNPPTLPPDLQRSQFQNREPHHRRSSRIMVSRGLYYRPSSMSPDCLELEQDVRRNLYRPETIFLRQCDL